MNYIDLLLGLGAGILLTVIVRTITDARREEKEKQRKHKIDVMWAVEAVNDSIWGNRALHQRFSKFESLENRMKLLVEAVSANGRRIEELEKLIKSIESKRK